MKPARLLFSLAMLAPAVASADDTLAQVSSFGSNPGNLEMFVHVPANLPAHAPLVVVLHGCAMTAASMQAAGWDALADSNGFAVLYPQQQSANNSSDCFNWFATTDLARGSGEAQSIVQMVDTLASSSSIDTAQVYVTGFSAGAAYAAVLLATYPDRFTAGSIMSGIPYKCATSENAAFTCMDMSASSEQTAAAWGALVTSADSGFSGQWPRVQIWHGASDYTVFTQNATELVKQWTDVHGLDQTATSSETIGGTTHQEYARSGTVLVDEYLVGGMGHDVAVGNDPSGTCPGTTGTYFVDESICSTLRAARFFGLGTSNGGGGSGSGSGGGGGGGGSGGGSGSGSGSGGGDDGDPPAFGACNAGGAASLGLVGVVLLGLSLRRKRFVCAAGVALALATPRAFAGTDKDLIEMDPQPAPAPTVEAKDTEAPATPPAVEADKAEKPKKLVGLKAGLIYTDSHLTSAESGNFLAVGWFPANDFTIYAGLGVTYNPNGQVKDALGAGGTMSDRWGSDLVLAAGYFLIDNPKRNIYMGPELVWITNIAPLSFADVSVVEAAWAIRYGIPHTPIAVGTDLGVTVTTAYGVKGPMISTAPFGLHIVYAFD